MQVIDNRLKMSDPGGSMEKYCSAFYDKHGLYNDGFPCPSDKYCCQSSDGNKMCCPINADNNNFYIKAPPTTSSYSPSTKQFALNSHPNLKIASPNSEPAAVSANRSSFLIPK